MYAHRLSAIAFAEMPLRRWHRCSTPCHHGSVSRPELMQRDLRSRSREIMDSVEHRGAILALGFWSARAGLTPAGLITRPKQGYATRSHWWSNQELCSKPGAGEA
jgi:hypothetical protein